ncbi:MAG: hypothetical protein GQ527_01545, partial [Bacteroidales bacterium]|nr:hypothetical protein [Bacteroidales bacterium]
MKNKFIILILSWIVLTPAVFSQHHEQCNHKVSFQKSSLSDSLDVLTYHIYIDSIVWDSDELYARTNLNVLSKIDNLN